jgi:hypothetical protein
MPQPHFPATICGILQSNPPLRAHRARRRRNLDPATISFRELAWSNLQFATLRARIEEEAKFWR